MLKNYHNNSKKNWTRGFVSKNLIRVLIRAEGGLIDLNGRSKLILEKSKNYYMLKTNNVIYKKNKLNYTRGFVSKKPNTCKKTKKKSLNP